VLNTTPKSGTSRYATPIAIRTDGPSEVASQRTVASAVHRLRCPLSRPPGLQRCSIKRYAINRVEGPQVGIATFACALNAGALLDEIRFSSGEPHGPALCDSPYAADGSSFGA
jgi:hypothetical protein